MHTEKQKEVIGKIIREMSLLLSQIDEHDFSDKEKFFILVHTFSNVIGWALGNAEYHAESIDFIALHAKKIAKHYRASLKMH